MSAETPVAHGVEAYIENCDAAALLSLLRETLGDFVMIECDTGARRKSDAGDANAEPGALRFYDFAQARLVMGLYEQGFSSCCLYGEMPWPDDVALARTLAPRLKRRVFCDPGAHYPEVHPLSDAFLLIDAQGERIVDLGELDGSSEAYVDAGIGRFADISTDGGRCG